MPLDGFGKLLLLVGLVIAGIGLLVMVGGRLPFLGTLPGDLSYERGNVRFYFPIVTSIVLSIIVTIVLNVVFRLFSRP